MPDPTPPLQDDYPTFLGVPLNRVLTIARGPINVIAATVASWLLVHVHFLGLFHVQHDGLSAAIAQGVIWVVTAILTDRGIAQWVKGHHIDMTNRARAAAVETVAAGDAGDDDPDGMDDDDEVQDFVDGLPADRVNPSAVPPDEGNLEAGGRA